VCAGGTHRIYEFRYLRKFSTLAKNDAFGWSCYMTVQILKGMHTTKRNWILYKLSIHKNPPLCSIQKLSF
jgi:hypothetical protein